MSETQQSTEAASPGSSIRKTEQSLRCLFSQSEMVELGRKIGEAHGELSEKENELSQLKSQFKSKIEAITGRISELAGNLTRGYEHRKVPCEVRMDFPKVGMKTTVRLDTGETVGEEAMTLTEMQREIAFHEKGEEVPEAAAPVAEGAQDGQTAIPAETAPSAETPKENPKDLF